MIEVREVSTSSSEDAEDYKLMLVVDGIIVQPHAASVSSVGHALIKNMAKEVGKFEPLYFHVTIHDIETANKVLDKKLSSVAKSILFINIKHSLLGMGSSYIDDTLELDMGFTEDVSINLNLTFTLLWWHESYSFGEFIESFLGKVDSVTSYSRDFDEDTYVLYLLSKVKRGDDRSIREVMSPMVSDIQKLHKETVAEFADPASISLRFDFPEAVKEPCEQYLIYFARFLKDAGMQATTDLKHETGGVLFTVTPDGSMMAPEDPEEALNAIRQALGIYLRLPANPIIVQTPLHHQPAEVVMLAATIKHLDSQLDMANALAQTQAATIQNQQSLIGHLSRQVQALPEPITPDVFVTSVRAVVDKEKDKEAFLGGTVELTKYEGQGFNINLAAAYRHVAGLVGRLAKSKNNKAVVGIPPTTKPAQISGKEQSAQEAEGD